MFQMTLGHILTALMGAAVFERFPRFRVVFGESGIGWLPLPDRPHGQRVSGPIPRHQDEAPAERILAPPVPRHVPVRPHRHQADRGYGRRNPDVGLRLPASRRHLAGSSEYIAKQFSHLPADVTHKITCENAGKFYGLMN